MARGRSSPGVGRNEGANLADPAAIRKALAIEVLDKERIKAATEMRKRHRKKAEGQGVVLADLDDLYKMKDMGLSEIVIWFRRKFNALGAVFQELGAQYELFTPAKGAKEVKAAHRHAGMMAGLAGKDALPPPGLEPAESNLWLEGHKEGHAARAEAWAEHQEEQQELARQREEAAAEDESVDED